MGRIFRNLALTGATGFAMAGSAIAGPTPQSTTFLVSAQAIKSCIVSATALAFGAYDQLAGAATTGTSTVNIQCTNGTVATMAWNGGVNGTLATTRKMKDTVSASLLNYNLYTTAANTSVWGDTTSSTVTQTYTSANNATVQPFTVYGTIPAGQAATTSAGATYQDTITVTVTF